MFFRLRFIFQNWKLGIHLIFGTYYFGVDNMWISNFKSGFGIPIRKRFNIKRLYNRYKFMKTRCFMGFIPKEDAIILFPRTAKKLGYKK